MANLNEAYLGLNRHDTRTSCCGSQFSSTLFTLPNGKTVDLSAIKAIFQRNSMLQTMNIRARMPVWEELGLTLQEYQYILRRTTSK